MIDPHRYACANWLITPAAQAVNEAPPADIADRELRARAHRRRRRGFPGGAAKLSLDLPNCA